MKRLFSAAEHTGDPSSLTGSGLARICCPAGHLCCQLSDCQGRVVAFQCLSTWFFSHLLLWWPVCLIRGHIFAYLLCEAAVLASGDFPGSAVNAAVPGGSCCRACGGGGSPVSSGGVWPLLMGWCCPASAPGVGDGAEGAAGRASWVPSRLSDNRLCVQAAHDFHMDPRLRRFQKQDISLFLVGSLYCWL